MALLFKNVECSSCHTRHNFGTDGGGWDPDAAYDYVCPQTAEKATMHIPETVTAEEASNWPQGAIPLELHAG